MDWTRAPSRVGFQAFPSTVSQTDRQMARQTGQAAKAPGEGEGDGIGGVWPLLGGQ
jgi:hypothetical protein